MNSMSRSDDIYKAICANSDHLTGSKSHYKHYYISNWIRPHDTSCMHKLFSALKWVSDSVIHSLYSSSHKIPQLAVA